MICMSELIMMLISAMNRASGLGSNMADSWMSWIQESQDRGNLTTLVMICFQQITDTKTSVA